MHPLSFIASGPMVSDWTHFTPEQSFPEGIEAFVSHVPSHPPAGSKVVCGVEAPLRAHVAAFAVMVVGSEQEPVGDVQVQVPQLMGASRSAWPSKPTLEAPVGHGGASFSSPIHTSVG
jgi:hypothetical protein